MDFNFSPICAAIAACFAVGQESALLSANDSWNAIERDAVLGGCKQFDFGRRGDFGGLLPEAWGIGEQAIEIEEGEG